jgi:hypothetical protein
MQIRPMVAAAPNRFHFPPEAKDPRFRAFFDYWAGKAPPDRLPGRQHIDPLEMKPFLTFLRLLDVVREGEVYRFRYRLIGSHVVDLHGPSDIGSYIDQYSIPAHYKNIFYPDMMRLMTAQQPHFAIRTGSVRPEKFQGYQRLNLPLATDGFNVDMIVGMHLGVREDGTIMES